MESIITLKLLQPGLRPSSTGTNIDVVDSTDNDNDAGDYDDTNDRSKHQRGIADDRCVFKGVLAHQFQSFR